MKILLNTEKKLIGYVLFPLSNFLLNRRAIIQTYHTILNSQWRDPEEIRELQFNKLRRVLTYSSHHVPFYRTLFKRLGLSPQDIRSLDDLSAIPPLSRDDLISDAPALVDERLINAVRAAESSRRPPGAPIPLALLRSNRLTRNTSSGSTGWPTVFFDDGTRSAVSWAHEMRLRRWFGVSPGAREIRLARLAGNTLDPKPSRFDPRRILWNQVMLPGTNLSNQDYRCILSSAKSFKPAVVWGYTPALAGLANFVESQGSRSDVQFEPELLITWAAPLYDHERSALQRVFKCPITNVYGAREVGHIAAMCPHGSMHINQENLIVEVDRNAKGNNGEILVTTLDSSPMPFVRYRMGDVGSIASSQCTCGRSLSVIKEFVGRTGEIFITKEGRMISPNVWCRLFMAPELSGAVRRFQVIYTVTGDIRVRIERGSRFTDQTNRLLEAGLSERFHPATATKIEYVKSIQPEVSGKYQMIVREDGT